MIEVEKWTPVYITTTTPADEAGNFYIPTLIPANITKLPAFVTDVAPTEAQIAAGKALKFDWLTKTWSVSGEDPAIKQMAAVSLQLAKQTQASNAQMAALALQLAKAKAADDKPAPTTTTTTATDGQAAEQPKEA